MQFILPMLAKAGPLPEQDDAFAWEVKWDGVRAIVYVTEGRLCIISRNGRDLTTQYPEITPLATAVQQNMILDGELVALAANGVPDFGRLQHRMGLRSVPVIEEMSKRIPVTYIIFDIMRLGEDHLLNHTYRERRTILDGLALVGTSWQTPVYHRGSGAEFLAATRQLGLEGIVAKHIDSLYEPGKRSGAWRKIKNVCRQELVIGGWQAGKGTRQGRIGSLLVGYYPHCGSPKLVYAGKVGTGFNDKVLDELTGQLYKLRTEQNPFADIPPVPEAVFVQPLLVGEVEFTQWTASGTLRHPAFKGLRLDKDPSTVVRE